ncbi:hypothetical protein [Chitinophaga tropicalis]|uniref:Uncharacterized protein n=1 Tax=Chitinophaga tropicalis TaxID=2683588 RepID=A0A7K1UBW1_9BACT|nr:hypothetical protein [Chitinophaga tropicalis]MVT11879.1 hypothetical protein [Chitinophaga tropicalis]
MIKVKGLYKVLAVILLTVFTINITPRAFIHQFFPHEDTEDVPVHHTDPAFSVKHLHCGFLQQVDPEPYEHTGVFFYSALVQHIIWRFPTPVIPVLSYVPHRMLSPRAPPVISLI